jgi:transcriptional regulator with AAA-type ATPase domain
MPKPFAEDDSALHTVPQRRFDPTVGSRSAFNVLAVDGPDKGFSCVLAPETVSSVLFGTSPACEARLTDRSLSRRHASLELTDAGVRVTDIGSMNGTWVNGVRITEAHLAGGEQLRMGDDVCALHRDHADHREVLPTAVSFGRVIGASREMRRLYGLCRRLAATDMPVIIEGETGTGKEVLAEAIHELGPRAQGPFVVFDCTAVPPSMIEAELFGYVRGASPVP